MSSKIEAHVDVAVQKMHIILWSLEQGEVDWANAWKAMSQNPAARARSIAERS